MGVLFNPFSGTFDFTGSGSSGSVAGSDTQIQFNDGGSLGADSTFVWDKTNDSLNVQTTLKQHALHVAGVTGATQAPVVTASISQVAQSLNSSPTGSISLISEFSAGSGGNTSQNTSGGGYTATGQTINYKIYPCIFDGVSNYYQSSNFESLDFTDALNDSSSFSVILTLGSVSGDATHLLIEKQIDGAGFNDSTLVSASSFYEDTGFSGTQSTSAWPAQYQLSFTEPTPPSGDSATQINVGFGNLTDNGVTYQWEIRSATNVSSVLYCEQTGLAGNSYTDPNMGNTFDLQIDWTAGSGDDQVIRISSDSGSTWSYYFVGSMSGQYIHTGQSSDSAAETAWNNDVATAQIQYAFKAYGKTTAPSGGVVYSTTADSYFATISTPNLKYIFRHNLSGTTNVRVLADYNTGVTNGIDVNSASFLDVGYSTWFDGTTITPNAFGFSGTNQVREYKLYAYNGTLLIYSTTALTLNTTDTGGLKYISGTMVYPSGATQIKITRGINGAAHAVSKLFTAGTTTFTDDAVDGSWNGNTTVAPTAAVPTTSRFDASRTSLSQSNDNLSIIETTGSGDRFPSIGFGWASGANSSIGSILARIALQVSTGHLNFGTARVNGYTNSSFSTQSWRLGDSTDFNLQKSSSTHFTVWGADASHPMIYGFSAGDSNRGTIYFGQSSTSFGSSSKVVIAPTAGGTTALHFRRTSGFSGDNILIDEAGSFRAGWGAAGRMFINATGVSSTTFLLIGGTSSGSQVRLSSGSGSGSTEGDIWNDSTRKTLNSFINGVQSVITDSLGAQTASITVANTVTETTITTAGQGTYSLPANYLTVGKSMALGFRGFYTTTGTPTLRFRFKIGGTTIIETGTVTMPTIASNSLFWGEIKFTCRTTGGSGTIFAEGYVKCGGTTFTFMQMVGSSTATVNTTTSLAILVSAQWGTSAVANTLTCALSNLKRDY